MNLKIDKLNKYHYFCSFLFSFFQRWCKTKYYTLNSCFEFCDGYFEVPLQYFVTKFESNLRNNCFFVLFWKTNIHEVVISICSNKESLKYRNDLKSINTT